MKIPLPGGGFLESDDGPRNTPYHRRIVSAKSIPGTRNGHWLKLDCGHAVQTFGNLAYANGVMLCPYCHDNRN